MFEAIQNGGESSIIEQISFIIFLAIEAQNMINLQRIVLYVQKAYFNHFFTNRIDISLFIRTCIEKTVTNDFPVKKISGQSSQ